MFNNIHLSTCMYILYIILPIVYIAYFMPGNILDSRNTKLSLCFHQLRMMA